jgi:hypothetical protein
MVDKSAGDSELLSATIEMPEIHDKADTLSLDGQRQYLRLTRSRLILVILAAAAGAATAAIDHHPTHAIFAIGAAICFTLALITEIALLTLRPEEDWYHGRAIAESTKTLAWRYAVRATPFADEISDSDATHRLLDRFKALLEESPVAGELPPLTGSQVTSSMQRLRGCDLGERKQVYVDERIDEQVVWYTRKAETNRKNASSWRTSMIALEALGAIFAILVLAGLVTVVLDGVLGSMVAGAGAWIEVKQFDNLAQAYSLTATELSFARSDADEVSDEHSWSTYVDSAEQAISREHTMWLARRVRPRSSRRREK